jgi:hypothetical protein
MTAVDWACRSDCAKSCGGCFEGCGNRRIRCRRDCGSSGGGCLASCDAALGGCMQTCLTARDRCGGECVKQVAAYQEEVRTNYGCKDKKPALEICKRTVACIDSCNRAGVGAAAAEACRDRCKQSRAVGCNGHFLRTVELQVCAEFDTSI